MGNYVTATEVQAEGAPSLPAARVNARILKWEQIVEQITRNVFRVIEPGELIFDGSNCDLLHFSIPLVEVTSLKLNNEETALDPDEYRAYTGRTPIQDDRQNPRIELTGNRANSIYTKTHGMFYKGMDQLITAKWGYVDDDPDNPGSFITPPALKAALLELVCLDLDGYFEQGGSINIGSISRERTDGHEIQYQDVESPRVIWSMIPKSIADVLALFRAPWKMTSPDNRTFAVNADQLPLLVSY